MSTLGLPFLSTLYRGISAAPGSGVLVADEAARIVGFAAFTADLSACYQWVLKHKFLSMTYSLLPNVLNPAVYRRIGETLVYPMRAYRGAGLGQHRRSRAELLAISVADSMRGHGIGKRLLAGVEERLRNMNVAEYYVVTHALDKRSNKFYSTAGFGWIRTFINHGKPLNEYIRVLGDQSSAMNTVPVAAATRECTVRAQLK